MSFSRTNIEFVIEQRLKLGRPLLPFNSVNYLAILYVFAYTQMCSHTHTHSTEKKQREGAYGWANLNVTTWTNNAVVHLKRSSCEVEAPPSIIAIKSKNPSQLSL